PESNINRSVPRPSLSFPPPSAAAAAAAAASASSLFLLLGARAWLSRGSTAAGAIEQAEGRS
ncbi:Os04g0102600, partial [Oryza sativa Japonica Group]